MRALFSFRLQKNDILSCFVGCVTIEDEVTMKKKSGKCRNKTIFLSNNGGKSIRLGQFVRHLYDKRSKLER